MKKLLLGAIGLVALSGSAMAADLAARPYKAPVPYIAPIYDWTGFYIGANGGWGESRNCWGIVPVGGAIIPDGCVDRSGGCSVASWVIAGNRVSSYSAWKPRATGRTSLVACQHPQSAVHDRRQGRRDRPVHRPDRICLELGAALFERRRGRDKQPV